MKQSKDYNYKGALEPIPVVVFKFYNMPNYILHKDVYEIEGKFKGILKSHGFSIRDIECLEAGLMNPNEFHNLTEWEG